MADEDFARATRRLHLLYLGDDLDRASRFMSSISQRAVRLGLTDDVDRLLLSRIKRLSDQVVVELLEMADPPKAASSEET
jgi:hypothetical protein